MKKYIITLITVLFFIITYGQQSEQYRCETIVKAEWENSYNSILNIEGYNEISGYFTGTYGSHTGTSGQYRVIGFVGAHEADGSIPITLTIHWKPISASKGTPDEKMTSIMAGQIYFDIQANLYKMELFHNLSVPVPIDAIVSDFNTPGNYTETLIFTVKAPASKDPIWNPSPIVSSDYTGVWYDDNNVESKVNIVAISADNVVQATYQSPDNNTTHLLKGFIGDSSSETAKSISLVGINSSNNSVISYSGLIDKIERNTENIKNIHLNITFDRYPNETSWSIFSNTGILLQSESYRYHYELKSTTLEISLLLPDGDYIFEMKDRYGDGICCGYGKGAYTITNNLNTLISGGEFAYSDRNSFTVEDLSIPVNEDYDYYYDGIYVEGRATGYGARYSAVKIEGFLMTGPRESSETVTSVELEQQRIPLTNNGATEWTTVTQIGSQPAENLKFAVDTGGNFNWANSVQCSTASCTDFNHHQFNQGQSTTFEWTDKKIQKVVWGPWGDAYANLGKDIIHFIQNQNTKNDFRLITNFLDNPQFNEFLWDGAIALPSNTSFMLDGMSNVVARFLSAGKIEPQENFLVSFYTNIATKTGKIQIGAVDKSLYDESSKVILPFINTANPQLNYLWSTPLASFDLNGKTFGKLPYFVIDSGSSALKGDSKAMNEAFDYAQAMYITKGIYPNINFQMGTLASTGQIAKLVLTSDQYVPLIDEGEHSGERVPQIQPLDGLKDILIQGSTLMNSVYTVFIYETQINPNTLDIELSAKEMWLYNLKKGPQIIQTSSGSTVAKKEINLQNSLKVYPNPLLKKGILTVEFNAKKADIVYFNITGVDGRLMYNSSRMAKVGINKFNLQNIIKDFKTLNQIVTLSVHSRNGSINSKRKIFIE